jgi:hypothetical protein
MTFPRSRGYGDIRLDITIQPATSPALRPGPIAAASPRAAAESSWLDDGRPNRQYSPSPAFSLRARGETYFNAGTSARPSQHRKWREKAVRKCLWLALPEAVLLIAEPDVRRLILKFGKRLNTVME